MTNGSFNHFYILSSLKPSEEFTAIELFKFIEAEKIENGLHIDLTHIKFDGFTDLENILKDINKSTLEGTRPIIHFECHGDPDDGLFFKDNTEIQWDKLSELLLKINRSSRFNLLIGLAACYGSEFFGNMSPMHPCPCLLVFAPAKEVDPGEVMSGPRQFYGTLLRTRDADEANRRLRNAQGEWLWLSAEVLFLGAVHNFITLHCTPERLLEEIKDAQSHFSKHGIQKSIPELTADFNKYAENKILNDFFDKYFSTDAVPENKHRFANLKIRVQKLIEELRGTGKYWI